ncbi:MAG: A/G-specific adenine glycosylase [Leadbetterella sp.]
MDVNLIGWYNKNRRDLPWRRTKEPYAVWLSEVILQQTRVAQGLPYYEKFISVFPTLADLAQASEEEVLRLWQGLGYYSRGRNLHKAAKLVHYEYGGVFPKTFLELRKLPGVGDYTAAAIASFCYNEPVSVVDGNVLRVISRLYSIEDPIDKGSTKAKVFTICNGLISQSQPAMFNQAIMELGSLVCTPQNPTCDECPWNVECLARKSKSVSLYPKKSSKVKVLERRIEYLVIRCGDSYFLKQREESGIWAKLFDFVELNKDAEIDLFLRKHLSSNAYLLKNNVYEMKHLLSHRKLHIVFHIIDIVSTRLVSNTLVGAWYTKEELNKVSKPVPIQHFFEKATNMSEVDL